MSQSNAKSGPITRRAMLGGLGASLLRRGGSRLGLGLGLRGVGRLGRLVEPLALRRRGGGPEKGQEPEPD